jgi:hypothetical protein
MTVYPFLRDAAFEPEIIEVMTGANEELVSELELTDRNDPLTEVIAKEVIEAAPLGVHNPAEMRLWVLNSLPKPQ